MWATHRCLLLSCPRAQESADCGGGRWGRPCLGAPKTYMGGVLHSPLQGQAGTKDRDAMGFFFGHHSPMPLCSLVVQASTTSIPFAELLPQSHPFRMFTHSHPQSSALVCALNPTFQHPALVCSGGHASQAGWAGQRSGPRVQVSLCPAATLVAMFSSTENEALLSKLSPLMWSPLLTFISPQGCRPHPTSSSLPFPSSFSCPT